MPASGARVALVDRDKPALTTVCEKHGDAVIPLVIHLLDPKACATPRSLEQAAMLTEVKHRRPRLQRMDLLHGERQDLELRLQDLKELDKPEILLMSTHDLAAFANQWKTDLSSGTMEKRRAIFRQLVEEATYDGDSLEIKPSC